MKFVVTLRREQELDVEVDAPSEREIENIVRKLEFMKAQDWNQARRTLYDIKYVDEIPQNG